MYRTWSSLAFLLTLFITACSQPAKKAKTFEDPFTPKVYPTTTLSLSKQELSTVKRVIQQIKLGKLPQATADLERILSTNPSPQMKCISQALLSFTALQRGHKREFMVFAEDMVKACKRFKFVPAGIKVLAKLYSNWSGKPLPDSLEIQLF